MKVKYIGETYGDLVNGNIYECLGKEYECYRIIDDSKEDYLYPIDEFEIVELFGKKILKNSIHEQTPFKYRRKNEDVFNGIEENADKKIILDFLTSFLPNFAATACVYDNVTKTEVKEIINHGYFDGEYYWDEEDIYHFEKYNMPLSDEFIKYVLSKNT